MKPRLHDVISPTFSDSDSRNSEPSAALNASGEYRRTGRPLHLSGPSRANVAMTTAPPGRTATPHVGDVAESICRVREEVKHRSVVPDVYGGHVPLARHVRFNPRDALLSHSEPRLRTCQCRARHVQHEDAMQSSFKQSVHKAGVAAANVDDAPCRGHRHRVEQPQ